MENVMAETAEGAVDAGLTAALDKIEPATPAPSVQETPQAAQPQEDHSEAFLSALQAKGLDGNRLDQAKRYFEDSRRLKDVQRDLETAKGTDTFRDFVKTKAEKYPNGLEYLEAEGPEKTLAEIEKQERGGQVEPTPDDKMSAYDDRIKRLEAELQRNAFHRDLETTLGKMDIPDRHKEFLRGDVEESLHLLKKKQELGEFVRQRHNRLLGVLGPEKTEERERLLSEGKKASQGTPPPLPLTQQQTPVSDTEDVETMLMRKAGEGAKQLLGSGAD